MKPSTPTKGDWRPMLCGPDCGDISNTWWIQGPSDDEGHQEIAIVSKNRPPEEQEANARVMALSPKLLKALKQMVHEVEYLIEDGTLPEEVHRHKSMVEARKVIDEIEIGDL